MPQTFAHNRDALHKIAEEIVSPARMAATGNEIALETTLGGFGTPAFPDGGWARVEGTDLVTRRRRHGDGGSSGDEHHEEPYPYVGPWTKPEPAPECNAVGFHGAEAPWTDEAAALAFFRDRRDALHR